MTKRARIEAWVAALPPGTPFAVADAAREADCSRSYARRVLVDLWWRGALLRDGVYGPLQVVAA